MKSPDNITSYTDQALLKFIEHYPLGDFNISQYSKERAKGERVDQSGICTGEYLFENNLRTREVSTRLSSGLLIYLNDVVVDSAPYPVRSTKVYLDDSTRLVSLSLNRQRDTVEVGGPARTEFQELGLDPARVFLISLNTLLRRGVERKIASRNEVSVHYKDKRRFADAISGPVDN